MWFEASGIQRSFGAINALRGVDFGVDKGEVIGLVGENGAGKSTLVKIISGFDDGFAGSIKIDGTPIRLNSPEKAQEHGIAIAQQELSLIPTMSVAENIFLVGAYVPRFATANKLAQLAQPFMEEVGLVDINPLTLLNRLSVGEQHLVEVARLIARAPQLLILDEPTAALGEADSQRIIRMVKRLAERGKSIIYVSHRLDEIFAVTDRVVILRDGESVVQTETASLNVEDLVTHMLGRKLDSMFPPRPTQHEHDVLMGVRELWPDQVLTPISIDVRKGEILGFAGQLGSGAGEMLAAIAGSHQIRAGHLEMDGQQFMPQSPRQAIKRNIAYCSSDRKYDGIFLGRPIRENMTAPALDTISWFGLRRPGVEVERSKELAAAFTVDVSRLESEAVVLSGGNQQKVALGKWLSIAPKVILVDEPTRGVDVGAKAEIYKHLRKLADAGNAIVMASTDLQEIAHLPDRIITFYKGIMVGELNGADASFHEILSQITDPFAEVERQVG